MLVLGANSDLARAFVEHYYRTEKSTETLHLVSSNPEKVEKLAQHYKTLFGISVILHELDLFETDVAPNLDAWEDELVFCATGYLGADSEKGLWDMENTQKILWVNYAHLVPVLQRIAEKLAKKGKGTLIIISSVAGERGRQSNFIYGSAKAGITAYTSGLRNYLAPKGVHVLTVKPGFMNTSMTHGMDLPKPLTAEPKQAAKSIYKAYKSKKNVIYVLWMWRWIMLIIRNIPEFIFKKMKL